MIAHHIQDAICLVDKARKVVDAGNPLCSGEIAALETLSDQIQVLRNQMVQHDLLAGMQGKDVAAKYNLSPARVSQIKRLVNF